MNHNFDAQNYLALIEKNINSSGELHHEHRLFEKQ